MQATFKNDSLNRLADAVGRSGRSLTKEFASACNSTANSMKVPIGQEIRTEFNAPAKIVKKQVGISRKANPNQLVAGIQVKKSKGVPLRDFNRTRQTKDGVSYQTLKSKPRKTMRRAFILPSRGDHVFQRANGAKRLPIKKRYGLSPAAVFVIKEMDKPMVAEAEKRLKAQIERRIQYNIFKANQLS